MCNEFEKRINRIFDDTLFITCDYPFCNGLVIEGEQTVVIDPGWDEGMLKYISGKYDVDVVIDTHFHIDHVYGNSYFKNAEVWIHEFDAPSIMYEQEYLKSLGVPTIEEEPFAVRFFGGKFYPSRVDRLLQDGDILRLGSRNFEVLLTPGHTKGHIALYSPSDGFVISGDIDLGTFGAWYGGPSCSLEDYIASCNRLLDLNPSSICTGHSTMVAGEMGGFHTDNVCEMIIRYRDIMFKREQRILDALQGRMTLDEIAHCNCIYKKHTKQALYDYELDMDKKHLDKLIREGKVGYEEGCYFKN